MGRNICKSIAGIFMLIHGYIYFDTSLDDHTWQRE